MGLAPVCYAGLARDLEPSKRTLHLRRRRGTHWTHQVYLAATAVSLSPQAWMHNWLVVSIPLKNINQLGWLFPINGKIEMFQTTNQIRMQQPRTTAACCRAELLHALLRRRIWNQLGEIMEETICQPEKMLVGMQILHKPKEGHFGWLPGDNFEMHTSPAVAY